MWHAVTEQLPSGLKYRILDDDKPLSCRGLILLLEHDDEFTAWYRRLLADADFHAFYWEHPPFTIESIEGDYEFVLLDAPALTAMPAELAPFRSIFDDRPDQDVVVFPNLGGDAILIAPRPFAANDAYPHLAAFLRNAPANQVRSLWRHTARAVFDDLTSTPRWLSTAGLGVAWVHIRLDSRPKYYRHFPYTRHP